jgi:regulator of protease activity HflC (stomatin/prohibitin superfamily)
MSEAITLFIIIISTILFSSINILNEYERAVVFTLGKFTAVQGPGIVFVIPLIQKMVRVDIRTDVLDVPSQDVISKDNISTRVNAVVYFNVTMPDRAIIKVYNYIEASSQLAQTTLRSVLGEYELDEMLSQREQLNARICKILDEHTDCWGIKISQVEIKDIDIDESMRRAIAKQAEAERDRRAKVIHADGELQASGKLKEAADVLSQSPQAIQLRYLDTLTNIASDKTSTIVFPLPIDIINQFFNPEEKS